MGKNQVPEWHSERFFNNIKDELDSMGEVKMEWLTTKQAMIATINYIRNKGYKCEWIEKNTEKYMIKISTKTK